MQPLLSISLHYPYLYPWAIDSKLHSPINDYVKSLSVSDEMLMTCASVRYKLISYKCP